MRTDHAASAAVRGMSVVAMVLIGLVGCSDGDAVTSAATTTTAAPPTSETTGVPSMRVDVTIDPTTPTAGVVEVEGTVTVPDGSHVNWALMRADEPELCPVDVPPEEDPCNAPYGSALVVDGGFAFRVDGVDPGDVEVFVAFDPTFGDQPVDVARRYGPLGVRMTGPQVVDYGGGAFRAQVTETVTVR